MSSFERMTVCWIWRDCQLLLRRRVKGWVSLTLALMPEHLHSFLPKVLLMCILSSSSDNQLFHHEQ